MTTEDTTAMTGVVTPPAADTFESSVQVLKASRDAMNARIAALVTTREDVNAEVKVLRAKVELADRMLRVADNGPKEALFDEG